MASISPTAASPRPHTTAPACPCPSCGVPATRVHSRYRRVVDLADRGRPVALHLTARRFRCDNPDCPRAVYRERLPDLAPPHARFTTRLTDSHRAIAFALGGEAGADLAAELGMPASPATLLRRIRQSLSAPAPTPRVLGVDDWAVRKGRTYGTILVDLERGTVIDLLPGRDAEPVKQWLLDHPGVEVVSRDRATAYARAASEGAPQAVQVADRWHLLRNAREMLERFLDRHRDRIRGAFPPTPGPSPAVGPSTDDGDAAGPTPDVTPPPDGPRRRGRIERCNEVRRRHADGQSDRRIAAEMGVSRNTVRRYLRQDHCPDWNPGRPTRTGPDGYAPWVDEQLTRGRTNATELRAELRGKGYAGSSSSVRRFVTKRPAVAGRHRGRRNAAVSRAPPPSPRGLSYDVLVAPVRRGADRQARVDRLYGLGEEFGEVLGLAEEFAALVRKERGTPLADWVGRAEGSAGPETRGFAAGVRQDFAAVSAALTLPWGNGPVEGQVNRLKAIERQMYGRAGLDLLRRRVRHAG